MSWKDSVALRRLQGSNRNKLPGSGDVPSLFASASPDDYLLSSIPVVVFRQQYLVKMSYDPMTDLNYIIGTSGYTFGVVARADSSWKSFKELLEYAKLTDALRKVPATNEARDFVKKIGGGELVPYAPAAMQKYQRDELDRFRRIAEVAGIKPE